MVKDTGKRIVDEVLLREGVAERAQSQVRSLIRLPAPFQWLERFTWLIPIFQEKTAPLTNKVKERFPSLFKKEQDLDAVIPGETTSVIALQREVIPPVDSIYRKYRCVDGNTLGCTWPQTTVNEDVEAKNCFKCGFPVVLPPKTEFRGYRGRYRIESWLGYRGMGRLYRGIQVTDQQPIIVKEYLLPTVAFNPEETKQRKLAFERLAGLSLADGRIQDIRLNSPWDAIADPVRERCYLVTYGNQDAYPTLSNYLATQGKMTSMEVRRVLGQVLQTLQFLHGQKFTFPSGQIKQEIIHGNISLDSLLISKNSQEFFIHLSDLALWERLFDLPTIKQEDYQVSHDLTALGYVAFYLLAGTTIESENKQLLNPKLEQHWQLINPPVDPNLRTFIYQLLNTFTTAEEAKIALSKIPLPPPQDYSLEITGEAEVDKSKLHRPPLLVLGILGFLLLGSLSWFLFSRFQNAGATSEDVTVCCLKNVSAVPPGNYFYGAEKNSTWNHILQQTNLILQNKTLENKLKESQPKLNLYYQPDDTIEQILNKMESGKIDFAMTNLVNEIAAPQLRYKEVAYDGLVVFVAFSYSQRDKSLPKALNGQISFEQIRDLYTGKIKNWSQLPGANLPNIPVKLYVPNQKEALRIFEKRVLKDDNAITTFRDLQENNGSTLSYNPNRPTSITTLSTINMLREVLRDFEDRGIGSIGFATLSQVFGQCSAYPLAISDERKPAIQSLVLDNGNTIDPNTDLCDDKGNYRANIRVFKDGSYPLGYPIIVVYPGDNSRPPIGQKFAEMLKTDQVQRLLEKAGLVPLQKTNR